MKNNTHIHIYTHLYYFFRFFSIVKYKKNSTQYPVLYSRSFLVIYFVYSSIYMLIQLKRIPETEHLYLRI